MEGVNCAYLNMSDPTEQCPLGFYPNINEPTRACKQSCPGCKPLMFTSYNINYTQVCGRVAMYQQGSPKALCTYTIQSMISIDASLKHCVHTVQLMISIDVSM